MTEMQRAEIGFAGGQVVSVRLAAGSLAALRTGLEGGEGWHDLETDDGTVALDLARVVFVRTAASAHTIGFAGD